MVAPATLGLCRSPITNVVGVCALLTFLAPTVLLNARSRLGFIDAAPFGAFTSNVLPVLSPGYCLRPSCFYGNSNGGQIKRQANTMIR